MSWIDKLSIYCADVGSVKRDRFGWFGGPHGRARYGGSSIAGLVDQVAGDLDRERPVALGFECPLWIPIAENAEDVTRGRDGEENRPWSAGAGATTLAIGCAELVWVLCEVRQRLGSLPPAHLEWDSFEKSSGLLLWEAMVTGLGKGDTHVDDARLAVEKFEKELSDPQAANAVNADRSGSVCSLAGAALLRAEWSTDISLLWKPCLVIKASERDA